MFKPVRLSRCFSTEKQPTGKAAGWIRWRCKDRARGLSFFRKEGLQLRYDPPLLRPFSRRLGSSGNGRESVTGCGRLGEVAVGRVGIQDRTEPALACRQLLASPGVSPPSGSSLSLIWKHLCLLSPSPLSVHVNRPSGRKGRGFGEPYLPFCWSPPVRGRAAGGGDRLRELPG